MTSAARPVVSCPTGKANIRIQAGYQQHLVSVALRRTVQQDAICPDIKLQREYTYCPLYRTQSCRPGNRSARRAGLGSARATPRRSSIAHSVSSPRRQCKVPSPAAHFEPMMSSRGLAFRLRPVCPKMGTTARNVNRLYAASPLFIRPRRLVCCIVIRSSCSLSIAL